MRALRISIMATMLLPGLAIGQTSSSVVEQCGANLKAAAYNTLYARRDIDMTTVDTALFCQEYRSQSSGANSGNLSFEYKGIALGAGTSNQDAKAIYEMACSSATSYADLKDEFVTSIRSVSAESMDAYETCLKSNQQRVSKELDAFNPKRLGVRESNLKLNDVVLKRIDMIEFGGVKCVGSLADVGSAQSIMEPGDTLSMVCARQVSPDGSLPDLSILMDFSGGDNFSYNWEGREACGTRGERSCTNVRKPDRRKKYPEEEGTGYDRSKVVSASSRESSLIAFAQSNIPLVCDMVSRENERKELVTSLTKQWEEVEVSSTKGHSCTKGSSGGTKDCGYKYTSAAPDGFANHAITTSGDGYRRIFNGTRGQIYLRKSGKGRLAGSVTAHWKLTPSEVNRRVSEDISYLSTVSSCFNGCSQGLSVNKSGICR